MKNEDELALDKSFQYSFNEKSQYDFIQGWNQCLTHERQRTQALVDECTEGLESASSTDEMIPVMFTLLEKLEEHLKSFKQKTDVAGG